MLIEAFPAWWTPSLHPSLGQTNGCVYGVRRPIPAEVAVVKFASSSKEGKKAVKIRTAYRTLDNDNARESDEGGLHGAGGGQDA